MRKLSVRSTVKRVAATAGLAATIGLTWTNVALAQPMWPSGMSCYWPRLDTLESWRGSRFGVLHSWAPKNTWQNLVDNFRTTYPPTQGRIRNGRLAAVSVPLLTQESAGQFGACVSGAFDNHFRQVATLLRAVGSGDIIIRLGAEANGNWQPYSINGNYDGFKACFRRVVQVMRSVSPTFKFEWAMNREVFPQKYQTTASRAYPGDDVVDIIGLSFYDNWPAATSDAVWNSSFQPELNFWANFARSRGKKLGFGEWGLGYRRGGGFDNPLYIQKMFEFFRANASLIAYESYFNCESAEFLVFPEHLNPRAARVYKTLW